MAINNAGRPGLNRRDTKYELRNTQYAIRYFFYSPRCTLYAIRYKLIMQNKPNFRKAKMNVNFYSTKDYENVPRRRTRKNKPNQTQSPRPHFYPKNHELRAINYELKNQSFVRVPLKNVLKKHHFLQFPAIFYIFFHFLAIFAHFFVAFWAYLRI